MKTFTLYHNPQCSKSRAALAILQEHKVELEVVEYLKTPLGVTQLQMLLRKLAISAREMVRASEDEFAALQLGAPERTEAEILAAVANNPVLLQRPIIECGDRAVIGRPPENVRALLS